MHFTVVDTLGVLKAFFGLAPFVFAPGYALSWALDLFGFRRRRSILRLVLAVPVSIAVCPIVSYLLARWVEPGLWTFYISATIGSLLLLTKEIRDIQRAVFSASIRVAAALVMVWVVIAIAALVDLQIGDKLYLPVAAYDHSTRVPVMAAIARHMPPTNPFFANPPVPLRYHYLWMLLCSLPLKVLHLSARHLMYAGVVWCGLGLMCLIALGLKFLCCGRSWIERKTLIAVALLSVTGLDILPTLYIAAANRFWLADMEWWNEVQVTSWTASVLWVPHHVAALIACFLGLLLLRQQAESQHGKPAATVIVAGIAFASAAGLSVYVAFTFLIAMVFWLIALTARKDWRELAMFAAAGAVAVIFALPYLSSLRATGSGFAFAEIALRPFPLGLHFAELAGINLSTEAAATAVNAILLPVNYGLELGFFLAIGTLRLRQVFRKSVSIGRNELVAWTLIMASFLVGTFLRSSTITTNDLGIRCFLPAQLILLLWAADILHQWWFQAAAQPARRPWARVALALLMLLGFCGTSYELFMIRMAPVLSGRTQLAGLGWLDSDGRSGERTYALRSLYEALDGQMPSSAVVQHNPATQNTIPHGLYSGRDAAAGTADCGTAFGGDQSLCNQRVRRLAALFELPGVSPASMCREYQIDVLVAKDTDAAWRDRSSWIWQERPLAANDFARAFRCGTTDAGVTGK